MRSIGRSWAILFQLDSRDIVMGRLDETATKQLGERQLATFEYNRPEISNAQSLYEASISLATAARICQRHLSLDAPNLDELKAIVDQMIGVADDAVLLSKLQREQQLLLLNGAQSGI
jgi:hypothetical protein